MDHLVLRIAARGAEFYGNSLPPKDIRGMVRERNTGRKPVVLSTLECRHITGHGR